MKGKVCQLFELFQHEFANLSLPCEGRFTGSLVKTLLSQEIFVTSAVDLKLNSTARKKRICLQGDILSYAFPGKCSVQYKLILIT